MSLFGALYVGTSGLQTNQNALNTTAHNLTNKETLGYTRQQVYLADRIYNPVRLNANATVPGQIGLGVNYDRARQVREVFLDKTYRRELGRQEYYSQAYETTSEVETLLGELYGVDFNTSLDSFFTAFQELVKTPDDTVKEGLIIQRGSALLERSLSVYEGLIDYQNNLNKQIKDTVKRINDIGDRIDALNLAIRTVEVAKIESPNDLLDERNLLLDELSGLASISYGYEWDGALTIKIEGEDFVKRDIVFHMDVKIEDPATGFYTPFWPQNAHSRMVNGIRDYYDISGAKVFYDTQKISSEIGNDSGKLKSLYIMRGNHYGTYKDLESPTTLNALDTLGSQADYDKFMDILESWEKNYNPKYSSTGVYDRMFYYDAAAGATPPLNNPSYPMDLKLTTAGERYYNTYIKDSVLVNSQAEFDNLIHNLAEQINKVIEDASRAADLKYAVPGLTDPDTGLPRSEYLKGPDGRPLKLFEMIKDSDGYTIRNLEINKTLLQEPTRMYMVLADDSVDYATAQKFVDVFTSQAYVLNPNVMKKNNIMEYYADLVSDLGNLGKVYHDITDTQIKTVEATDYARQEVVGVVSDEELNNMLMFQNAFNASSRYFNVISEMMEHIITRLGHG